MPPFDANTFTRTLREIQAKYAKSLLLPAPLEIANPLDPEEMEKTSFGLWVPKITLEDIDLVSYYQRIYYNTYAGFANPAIRGFWGVDATDAAPTPAVPYEVNMMEALVGWKTWELDSRQLLRSPSQRTTWTSDEKLTAKCRGAACAETLEEHCSCGIYASDAPREAKSYGKILGQVYGWGRYVRGDAGWRSQFAYPKSFHLTSDQTELIEPLKKYHVEIFIDQPIRMYDPQEEGYGYRETDQNGHCGAAADSGPEEEGGCGASSSRDEED